MFRVFARNVASAWQRGRLAELSSAKKQLAAKTERVETLEADLDAATEEKGRLKAAAEPTPATHAVLTQLKAGE